MNRLCVLGFVTALLVVVPGCSSNDPDSLMKERISLTNDLASAIEKKESADKIKSIAEKLKASTEKFASIKMSGEESKKLMEKYQNELMESGLKLAKAAMTNPDGIAALKSIGGFGDGFQVSGGGTTTTTTTSNGSTTTTTSGSSGGKKK